MIPALASRLPAAVVAALLRFPAAVPPLPPVDPEVALPLPTAIGAVLLPTVGAAFDVEVVLEPELALAADAGEDPAGAATPTADAGEDPAGAATPTVEADAWAAADG